MLGAMRELHSGALRCWVALCPFIPYRPGYSYCVVKTLASPFSTGYPTPRILEDRGDSVATASEELLAARDELARLAAEYEVTAARAAELG